MSKIGSFGDIVFEVSPSRIQTFDDFERSGSARWEDQEIIGRKPKSQFNGPDLDEISFSILLKAELGVNPAKQMDTLRKMKDTGKVAPLIIGGKPVSPNNWSIRQLRESHKKLDNQGNILIAELNVSLKEYFIKPVKTSKSKTSSNNVSSKNKALGKITITAKTVNIRSGPSTSAKIVSTVNKGKILTVYSEKNGWYSLGSGKYITSNTDFSTLKKG